MAATNINQDGIYQPTEVRMVVGTAFSYALTGSSWVLRIINNAPTGPDKFYLECSGTDGLSVAEVLQGKPPGGIALGQGQNHWISGNNGTSNVPQIDYIIDESTGYVFKVISILNNNWIEIEYPGIVAADTEIAAPFAHYTKGVQINEMVFDIIGGVTISVMMRDEAGVNMVISQNTTLNFTEGSGPVVLLNEAGGGSYVAISFKKSLERLS